MNIEKYNKLFERVELIQNILFYFETDDPKHQIQCHIDTVPIRYENLCNAVEEVKNVITAMLLEDFA